MLTVFITAVLCIIADRVTKYFTVEYLKPVGQCDLIPGVLRLSYVENKGAAFGSLTNHRWVFIAASLVLIAAIIAYVIIKKPKASVGTLALGLVLGGGIGNMIDRLFYGYVVDFIDFCAFPKVWMWVFNGADAFVCVGAALLVVWLLVTDYKERKAKTEASAPESETAEANDDGE